MPVKPLPEKPDLDQLRRRAKDLLRAHRARDKAALQRIREFHPRFRDAADLDIGRARFALSDAQLAIAREHGYASWPRLKQRIERPEHTDDASLPQRERIADPLFRRAVDLLDAGDAAGLRAHLAAHPHLARQRVRFEGGNYFQHPSLLDFAAENPVRHGHLPPNIAEVAGVVIDAGADREALTDTLELVASGRVPREHGVQVPLIDLLCARGAEPDRAMLAALAHGEFAAVDALLRCGARLDLPAAAALGRDEDAARLLPAAGSRERHVALALAAQFGHAQVVRLLLDAGEDPSRYNPVGAHAHATPLHHAALGGHGDVVRLLVERGARLDLKDTIHHGTPLAWAMYAKHLDVVDWLRAHGGQV